MGREQEEEGKRDNLRIVKRECIMCEWIFAYLKLFFEATKKVGQSRRWLGGK